MQGALTVTLPSGALAPIAARKELDRFMADHVDEARRPDVRLLVTELVTNGVLHGEGEVRLEARMRADTLHVEVIDEGDGMRGGAEDPDREGGWGLVIVDSLADRWGVFAGSTHVWFEIDAGQSIQ